MENKSKKKIYISLVVLFVVALVIIGTAYAYYRTVVKGNSEEKSLTVISKNLRVTYSDDNALLTATNAHPGSSYEKEFYVTSVGKTAMDFGIKVENVENTFNRLQDWTYKIVRVFDEKEEVLKNGTLPNTSAYILNYMTIEPNITATYKLVITYDNAYEDQSEDMGKNLSFKINLAPVTGEVFEGALENTLLAAIANNNVIANPLTTPGREPTLEKEAILSNTVDDYGESYYFRGNVKNNFVTYSGMCWRIVRVDGNGNIRLALADENYPCSSDFPQNEDGTYSGYNINNGSSALINNNAYVDYASAIGHNKYNTNGLFETSNIPAILENWSLREEHLLDTSKLESVEWCNDMSIYSYEIVSDSGDISVTYGAAKRLIDRKSSKPSLECNFTELKNQKTEKYLNFIGIPSADELAFSGATSSSPQGLNLDYYFMNNANSGYWTMSPFMLINNEQYIYDVYYVDADGELSNTTQWSGVSYKISVRPMVALKKDVTIVSGGDGTQSNPYVIS